MTDFRVVIGPVGKEGPPDDPLRAGVFECL